jgi:hypothetical protein
VPVDGGCSVRGSGGGDVRADTIRSDPITASALIEATVPSSSRFLPYLPLTLASTHFRLNVFFVL